MKQLKVSLEDGTGLNGFHFLQTTFDWIEQVQLILGFKSDQKALNSLAGSFILLCHISLMEPAWRMPQG